MKYTLITQCKKMRTKQAGYTMIELLLVIAIIIGLTSVMIYALASRANKQAAIHECAAQVANIVVAERSFIQRDPAVAIANSDLSALKPYGLDSKIADLKGKSTNPWGGDYTLGMPKTGQFIVTIVDVPTSIVTNYQTLQNSIQRLTEHDTTADDASASAKGACSADTNTITCTFDNG